jgi:hypothetical protein
MGWQAEIVFHRNAYSRRDALTAAAGGFLSLIGDATLGIADESNVTGPPLVVKAPKLPEMKRWPPHWPSTRHYFLGEAMKPYLGGSEAEVVADYKDALNQTGYRNIFYFGLPVPGGGVAFATPFERINDDGTPIRDRSRFDIAYSQRLTIVGWKPIPRHLRAFLFLLGEDRIPTGSTPKSFSRHQHALESGVKSIGQEIQFGNVTSHHRLTVFMYEYYAAAQEDPNFIDESPVHCLEHLKKTGILPP